MHAIEQKNTLNVNSCNYIKTLTWIILKTLVLFTLHSKRYETRLKHTVGDCNVLLFSEVHSFDKHPHIISPKTCLYSEWSGVRVGDFVASVTCSGLSTFPKTTLQYEGDDDVDAMLIFLKLRKIWTWCGHLCVDVDVDVDVVDTSACWREGREGGSRAGGPSQRSLHSGCDDSCRRKPSPPGCALLHLMMRRWKSSGVT